MEGKAKYRIKVIGRLDEGWSDWFEGMCIKHEPAQNGTTLTVLESGKIDQSALHGTLSRLRDLNLILYCLERIEETASGSSNGDGKSPAAAV